MTRASQLGKNFALLIRRPIPSAHHLERTRYAQTLPLYERLFGPSPWSTGGRKFLVLSAATGLVGCVITVFYAKSASARERGFESAMLAVRVGDYPTALAALTSVTKREPSNAVAFYELGNINQMLGRDTEAMDAWTTALRLDPAFDAAYLARGRDYFKQGNFLASLGDFERAVSSNPSTEAYLQRAFALQALGRHTDALRDFDEATAHAASRNPNVERARQVSVTALTSERPTR
jgi:tetratricopeptide (TPR) repeat protein